MKQMTDKEIIKTAECCLQAKTREDCHDLRCPCDSIYSCMFFDRSDDESDFAVPYEIIKELLGVINRQQEQLESTIAGQESLQKALTEKDREIEHLNKEVDRLSQCVLYHDGHIEDAKSEAIREFSKAVIDGIDEGYISHSSDMVDFTQNYLNVKGVLKMGENLRYKSVIIRKPHVCFGCGRSFDPPARMTSAAYADGGTVDSYYLCETCTGIASEMGFDDEFGFGDLRDEALEREQNG
ncbi:MAG: hypothetical protein Q4B62_05415 [Clostridiaceae bacterium]|nr:hypothetical protein [Clostridiaceae bacterium]